MLRKQECKNREQIVLTCVDELVPKDHLLRKIDEVIDFDFIYDAVADLYSSNRGRPSVDPVVLIKIVLLQYLFCIGSMRKTIEEIKMNVAYRWFLGMGMYDKIPHFSTFGKNYDRRFKDSDVFEVIFTRILDEVIKAGFIDPNEVFIDSTHVKACANKHKYSKEEVVKEAKRYQSLLDDEIEKSRIEHGKKPLKKKNQLK